MKKVRQILLVAIMLLMPSNILAGEGEFFIGMAARSGNLWISPLGILAISQDLAYDWMSVSDDQGKIAYDDGNPFGFKAIDLFRSFGLGVTFGYQPLFSPFGIYATAGYDFRQFKMQPDRSTDSYETYRPSSLNVGLGVRFAPLLLFIDDDDTSTSPFIEVSTRYNKVFSCVAPYDNAKKQFGSGFTTRFAIGVRSVGGNDELYSFFAYYEMPNYNYFNKNFALEDGSMPYQHIDAKMHRIGLGMSMEF